MARFISGVAFALLLIWITHVPIALAQDFFGVHIGDDQSALAVFGAPGTTHQMGAYVVRNWFLEDTNELSVTTSRSGKVLYMEIDWGGHMQGATSPFPGFYFGRTSHKEIVVQLGSHGLQFSQRPPVATIADGVVMLNTYEVEGVMMTTV